MDIQIPVIEIINSYKAEIQTLVEEKVVLLERALLAETQVRVLHGMLEASQPSAGEPPQEA